MPIFVNDNGTLRESEGLYVNDNGTLRSIDAIYVNDNGTLRTVRTYRAKLPSSISFSGFNSSGGASGSLSFAAGDGSWTTSESGLEAGSGWTSAGDDWLGYGAAADYEIRLTKTSGTDPDSGTMATWIDASLGELWVWSVSGSGSHSFGGTLEIRDAATQTVRASMGVSVSISFIG